MTDLNPIIADRFTEHLEVFGKTMEHMDTIRDSIETRANDVLKRDKNRESR